jgi:hypothetical protein
MPDTEYLTCIQVAASIALFLALHFGITDVLVDWLDGPARAGDLGRSRLFMRSASTRAAYTRLGYCHSLFICGITWSSLSQSRTGRVITGLPVQSSVTGVHPVCSWLWSVRLVPIAIWSYRHLEMPTRKWINVRLTGLLEGKQTLGWQWIWVPSDRKR